MLSEEMVENFRELYLKRYGSTISQEEARKQGTALLELMKVIYRPFPQDEELTIKQDNKNT